MESRARNPATPALSPSPASGRGRSGRLAAALISLLCTSPHAFPQSQAPDIASQTLEQLSAAPITVSSFARRNEDLWLTPAAVFIISKEDIANSTASSIPELLRVVPGLQVAQVNASTWAVSARGFNGEDASKLLILIDGRTVYSEIYSGAHWDEIDLPLESIERIEVLRGPGAAVWGPNAVNGVINIISKTARNTTGTLLSGHIGRIDRASTIGYGGSLGPRVQYRAYARYIDRQPFDLASGAHAFDGAGAWSAGGRLDWQKNSVDSITTTAGIYAGHLRSQLTPSVNLPSLQEYEGIGGGHLLSRWEHNSGRSNTALQAFYDDQSRHELGGAIRTRTFDLDYQSHLAAGGRHDLVWGSEFRFTTDHTAGQVVLSSLPDYKNYLGNGFLQDEIALVPQHLTLTLGAKLQGGTLAGFQFQPSIRLTFAPREDQTVWAAVSQAALSPSIQNTSAAFPLVLGVYAGLPVTGKVLGRPGMKAETVLAYELGYRRRFRGHLTADLAGFFNDNRRLQSLQLPGILFQPTPAPHLEADISYGNGFKAKSGGAEASLAWKPLSSLALQAGYTWMEAHTTQVVPGSLYIVNLFDAPRNAYTGSATWTLAPGSVANVLVSRVGNSAGAAAAGGGFSLTQVGTYIPGYTRVDARLSHKLAGGFQFSVAGTNLQSARHLEFDAGTGFIAPAYVPRSLSLSGTWIF